MNLNTILLVAILCIAGPASADSGPNFSGKWMRIAEQSDPQATMIGGNSQPVTADLLVRHDGTTLRVEKQWSHKPAVQSTHIIDGNEHTGVAEGGGSLVYRALWEGDKLVIEESMHVDTPFGSTDINTREEWSLSEDGNILTIRLSRITPMGEMKTQQAYRKR